LCRWWVDTGGNRIRGKINDRGISHPPAVSGRYRGIADVEGHMEDLKKFIREIPDFPKPGILFYDITTLLQDPLALRMTVDRFVWIFARKEVDKVVGMESRGFMFGPIVAYDLNAGFVPVRKPGKLPAETVEQTYELEYGTDRLQMHKDAISPGEQVLIVDDLVATGGTALATAKLVEDLGGKVVGFGFVVELTFLQPRKELEGYTIESLIQY
jgi:adenine phosphoribosyltransferase